MERPIFVRFRQFGGRTGADRDRLLSKYPTNYSLAPSITRKSDTSRLSIDAGMLYL
jgi:hypothetical protein